MYVIMFIIRNDVVEIELYYVDDFLVLDNNILFDNDGYIYKKGDVVYYFYFFF